ncbi:MAG: cytochrome C [Hyphomicrobiaceae bacterium]
MFITRAAHFVALICGLAWGFASGALSPCAAAAEDKPSDAQFIKSCGTCHTVVPGAELRQGPNLGNVFGRTAGTLGEYPQFSDALKKAGAGGLVWNEETLDKWISGASDFVPGTNMPYSQPDPEKRKIIIAYLKSLAPSK